MIGIKICPIRTVKIKQITDILFKYVLIKPPILIVNLFNHKIHSTQNTP